MKQPPAKLRIAPGDRRPAAPFTTALLAVLLAPVWIVSCRTPPDATETVRADEALDLSPIEAANFVAVDEPEVSPWEELPIRRAITQSAESDGVPADARLASGSMAAARPRPDQGAAGPSSSFYWRQHNRRRGSTMSLGQAVSTMLSELGYAYSRAQ